MAKVRVYELARDLNMDSRELVEKLTAAGLGIKNYMSTLDDALLEKAKEIAVGRVSEVVEEKRIRPTVIRRRKVQVVVQPEAEEGLEAEPEAPEEAPELVETVSVHEEERDEAVAEPPESEVVEEVEVMAEAVAHEEFAPPFEKEVVEEAVEEPEAEEVAEVAGAAEVAALTEAGDVQPVAEVRVKPKKVKKRRVDQPARIIKLPEVEMEEPVSAAKVEQPPVKILTPAAGPQGEAAEKAEDETQKSKFPKKKKDKRRVEIEVPAPKGAVKYRKKEIFERAELYEGKSVKRKERKGGKETVRRLRQPEITVPRAIKRRIKMQETVTVAELAKAMGLKGAELLGALLKQGVMVHINQAIDFETASLVSEGFGYELELDMFQEETLLAESEDRPEDLIPRPPVVTIMGHVDHGKTSLLDFIRHSNIAAGESGGITQHIGAYYVETDGGDIVFLDTPGHEAFTAMRARGAKVTDLIVLVVAADDGVMPQTREAVNHARAASIPIVVAINKIDKADANPDRVKRELAELGLSPEEWGGETIFGNISAKTGEGIDDLLGLILLQSEMLELKGNPNKAARGSVIEAKLDKTRGPLATVLIKNGTLKPGDYFICGHHSGKVRAMMNHRGKRLKLAGPSVPVEIYGISGVPMAGDEFIVLGDEKAAKQVIEHRKEMVKKLEVSKKGIVSLDDLFKRIKDGEIKELNIVAKADVQGSMEALSDSLARLSTGEVKVRMIHSASGAITESDVMLASASGAIIIGFNVRANPRVVEIAEKEKVDIRYYDVIYNVIKDIRNAMAGLLEPTYKERVIGRADIKEVFHVPKVGAVAGSYVTDGHLERNANVRVLRDDVVVFTGKIGSLRRFKEDVKEVAAGYECGIGIEGYQDLKPGDVFEVFQLDQVAAEL
jgi:translation initiation factor IF-2